MNATAPRAAMSAGARQPRFTGGRILVREVNWLGDLVMTMPALRAVRAAFATSSLSVLVPRKLAGFFDGMRWIDEVITFRSARGWQTLGRDWEVIRAIRARRFDLAILFPNSFGAAWWTTLAGVPRRAGYATDRRGLLLTHRAIPSTDALTLHQSHYWLGMVRDTLGIELPDSVGLAEHKLEPSNGNLERVRTWLAERRVMPEAPLIAIAPAAAYGPAKE